MDDVAGADCEVAGVEQVKTRGGAHLELAVEAEPALRDPDAVVSKAKAAVGDEAAGAQRNIGVEPGTREKFSDVGENAFVTREGHLPGCWDRGKIGVAGNGAVGGREAVVAEPGAVFQRAAEGNFGGLHRGSGSVIGEAESGARELRDAGEGDLVGSAVVVGEGGGGSQKQGAGEAYGFCVHGHSSPVRARGAGRGLAGRAALRGTLGMWGQFGLITNSIAERTLVCEERSVSKGPDLEFVRMGGIAA